MTCSPARLAANRLNALRSTGPRTAEGKHRSRANALKHGMTGAGVVLPHDEAAEVDARAARLHADMKPTGEMSRILLRRIAVLATRLERCDRVEKAVHARKVREALKARDDARRDEADDALALLPHDPDRATQRMMATPQGIDGLIEAWQILRGRAARAEWGDAEARKVDLLLGRFPGIHPPTQFDPLLRAVDGDFSGLSDDQGGGLSRRRRIDWAREQVAGLIDDQVRDLRELRELVDDEDEAIDRAEAADRALAVVSEQDLLARKYEAASAREMFRALREFHAVERRARSGAEPEPEVEPEPEPEAEVEVEVEPAPIPPEDPAPAPEAEAAPAPVPAPAAAPIPVASGVPGSVSSRSETNPSPGPRIAADGSPI